ncbi:MAG: hypothetical protein AB7O32_19875 [Vicinamibacterales bacterium]
MLGLLAVVVMAFTYVVTSRLNAASERTALDRAHNARALARAKQALIGYMAQQAALSGENNPGHLPCPEAAANYGTANEGIEATFCSAPAIGRLPWRTLGLEKLVDAAGEPLWYAVSPGWHRPNSTSTLTINSDSTGQLALSGVAANAVALIIAPGAALIAQACGGAAATAQARPVAGAPDYRNYLECGNADSPADTTFVASAPGSPFNDQVLAVLPADVMPALEAAIAERMQREIAPALRSAAYTSAQYAGIPPDQPLYPYATQFGNPGSSNYLGNQGIYQGLLPVSQIRTSCASPQPCAALPVTGSVRETLGYGYVMSYSCSASSTEYLCTGQYHENDSQPWREIRLEMTATFSNVAMGLRVLNANPASYMLIEARDDGATGAWETPAITVEGIRMHDGSTSLPDGTTPPRGAVSIRFRATMPNIDDRGWDSYADFRMRINRGVFDDHALLKGDDPALGWFTRNEWYRVLYYAVAQTNTADSLSTLGCTNTNCLRFNEGLGCGSGAAWCNIRTLLVLGGASLTNQSRPNGNLADYVEYTNGDGGTFYEQHGIRRSTNVAVSNGPWNDRVILVDWLNWQTTSLQLASPNNHPQVVADTTTSPVRVHYLPLP